jgi:HAD superfamily hydrolase (TIGR01509 family)
VPTRSAPLARWVLFDVGGVLIDWDDAITFRAVADRYKLDRDAVANVLIRLRRDLQSDRLSLHEFWVRFARSFGIRTPEDWRTLWVDEIARRARPRKDVLLLAETLRQNGVRTGLFSNTDRSHWKFLRSTGWFDRFSPQILSFRIGAIKPDAEAFGNAERSFYSEGGMSVLVDDSAATVEAARTVGWDAIRFTSLRALQRELSGRHFLD